MQTTISRRQKMESQPIPKLVMSVSLPLMISLLVQSTYNLVDGIFVSHISMEALACTSLAYPMQMLMIAVSVGTGVGVNSLLSRRFGANDKEGVRAAALNGLMLSVLSSLVFLLLGIFAVTPFLSLFTSDVEMIKLSGDYLRICLLFNIGIFIATMAERLLQATGNSMLSMIAQVSGAVVNIVLDPLLIFGLFGLPAMGVRGAAIATVAGQWFAAAMAMLLNYHKNKDISLSLKGFRPSRKIVWQIYKVGLPSMLVQAMGSVMMILMNKILIQYSAINVAFFSAYYKLHNFLFMPISGLSQGLIPIIGFNFGAKNGKRILEALRFTLKIALGVMLAGVVIFMLMPHLLLKLYNASDEMLAIGVPAMRIISLSFVPQAISLALGYTFTAMGNGMVNMVSAIMRQLLVGVYVYILASCFGIDNAWFGFLIAEYSGLVYVLLKWRKIKSQLIIPILDKQ